MKYIKALYGQSVIKLDFVCVIILHSAKFAHCIFLFDIKNLVTLKEYYASGILLLFDGGNVILHHAS